MKTETKLIMGLIAILTAIMISFIFLNLNLTGNPIAENRYSFTKAICDENKLCQDYEITCKGNQVVSTIPITGAIVQFNDSWEDPRNKSQIEKLC